MNPRLLFASGVALSLLACEVGTLAADGFNEQEQALITEMVLPAVPPWDPDNQAFQNQDAILLGQKLFFDPDISVSVADGGTGKVSCADCHMPSHAFSDAHSPNGDNLSQAVDWTFTKRNTPTVLNVAYYKVWPWGGRSDRLWLENVFAWQKAQHGTEQQLMNTINLKYLDQYLRAFNTGNVQVNMGKALAAYERTLVTTAAPLDRYAQGERDAMSPAQKRGLKVFLGRAGCVGCHKGPMLSDGLFHSVGIGQTGPNVPVTDLGLWQGLVDRQQMPLAPDKSAQPLEFMKGLFRTKSLREIARTGPYFHAGQVETLAEVVDFYDRGGNHEGAHAPDSAVVPLGLTAEEKEDLVAFLGALSGVDPSPTWTQNPLQPGGMP